MSPPPRWFARSADGVADEVDAAALADEEQVGAVPGNALDLGGGIADLRQRPPGGVAPPPVDSRDGRGADGQPLAVGGEAGAGGRLDEARQDAEPAGERRAEQRGGLLQGDGEELGFLAVEPLRDEDGG